MADIRKSPEYQRWRKDVKHRDEDTCRVCAVQRNLHVHHIKPLEKYPEFATDLDNGLTLCGNCHVFLSGREENTNLQTIIEAFTGQQDAQTTEQLKRLNAKFCVYLESLLKSEDQDTVSDAVHKMFVHLHTYPDSLDPFLPLIEYILGSDKGFADRFARKIAMEVLKNHSNKTASEILSKYETLWNYQDGRKAYLRGDYATALKKFEPLAESGHAESQYDLGVIYEEGRGVAKDAKTAIKWYTEAAQHGNTEAHTRLERIYAKRRVTPEQGISDQHRADFETIRRKGFLAKTIAHLEAKGQDRTFIEKAQLRALTETLRTDAQQRIYDNMLQAFVNRQVARLQAKPQRSETEERILAALTAVQAAGIPAEIFEQEIQYLLGVIQHLRLIPAEAFEQETPLTRQIFFQKLSLGGIKVCLSTLKTYDVKIEIKKSGFTLLAIDRSSGDPVSGRSPMSGSSNALFSKKFETESDLSEAYRKELNLVLELMEERRKKDLSEAFSQLHGEVFLTQEDIPILRAFMASIKADL